MAIVAIQLPKTFPRRRGMNSYSAQFQGSGRNIPGLRGLGRSMARGRPTSATSSVVSASPSALPQPVTPFPTTSASTNSANTSYGAGNWSRSRQSGGWGGSGNGAGGGNGMLQQSQNSDAPTQADIAAFNAALENASALGVISASQAAQLQSQATQSTDQQLQSLTSQINSLVAATPSASAATAAATAAAATTTTTSWWDGSTVLFGSTITNSTLAIGAGLAAIALWAAFKKK